MIVLEAFADGSQSSTAKRWFTQAAAQDDYCEAWYFDEECLEFDGWVIVEGKTKDAPPRQWQGWRKGK